MRVSKAPLPSPPDDEERDAYFTRHIGILVTWGAVGMTGILIATAKLSISHAGLHIYLLVAAMAAMFFLVSFRVNVFTHDADVNAHRSLVENWKLRGGALPSIDVWLPVAGEPLEVLENSWRYVSAIEWAGPIRVLVGDDADSPEVKRAAERHGFDYFVRTDRPWMKKAGNMRNLYLNSDHDFVLILDADFCPRPDFLYELMPYFDAKGVGIVQSPQHFRVLPDQNWLERGAGAVQELFYRAIQTSREQHNGAVCVGTNAVYRRAALDDNGGTTLYEHSEDIRTGFDVRLHGWKLTYVPVSLATGLCPDQLHSFHRQQYRWCLGSVTLLCSRKFWGTKMDFATRCCYLAGFGYYLSTAINVVLFPLLPVILLAAFPSMIHLNNYVILAPALLFSYVGFPMWHRCRWGLEAWSVQMIYGWSHLFAIIDMVRRRGMDWTPTGAAEKRNLRKVVFSGVLLGWSGSMAALWLSLALMRWMESGYSLAFLPLMAIGTFYLLVVIQTFVPTESPLKEATA